MMKYIGKASVKFLIYKTIKNAVEDISGLWRLKRFERYQSYLFLIGDTCKAYCEVLGLDHAEIKRNASALYNTPKQPRTFRHIGADRGHGVR